MIKPSCGLGGDGYRTLSFAYRMLSLFAHLHLHCLRLVLFAHVVCFSDYSPLFSCVLSFFVSSSFSHILSRAFCLVCFPVPMSSQ